MRGGLPGRAEPYFVNSEPAAISPATTAGAEPSGRACSCCTCARRATRPAPAALEDWSQLFALADRHGFVIAADECYSEIYPRHTAPLGALEAAHQLGRSGGEHPYAN